MIIKIWIIKIIILCDILPFKICNEIIKSINKTIPKKIGWTSISDIDSPLNNNSLSNNKQKITKVTIDKKEIIFWNLFISLNNKIKSDSRQNSHYKS